MESILDAYSAIELEEFDLEAAGPIDDPSQAQQRRSCIETHPLNSGLGNRDQETFVILDYRVA